MYVVNVEFEKINNNSFIWCCIKRFKFKKLFSSLFEFQTPTDYFKHYYVRIYPFAFYIHIKE